jgi:hypothetical protein
MADGARREVPWVCGRARTGSLAGRFAGRIANGLAGGIANGLAGRIASRLAGRIGDGAGRGRVGGQCDTRVVLDERAFAEAVDELTARDADLARLVADHGRPALWSRPAGFPSLVLLILEQQVSLASCVPDSGVARSVWSSSVCRRDEDAATA